VAVVAAASAVLPISNAAAESKSRERAIRIGAITGAIGLFVASETVAKDALCPDDCR
jgi:hypothetical protein